jgi:xanthine/CO dehydrogenase XdhC/CoxF family maturation factor
MKEINAIIAAYEQLDFTKTQAALATVIRVEGSSYRREGARMLITSDGQWTGGISGGCLEGDALRKAHQVIFSRHPKVVTYNTLEDDPFQIGAGLGCRGIIDVLIEPVDPEDEFNPVRFLKKCAGRREACALVTVVRSMKDRPAAGDRYLLTGSGEESIRPGSAAFQEEYHRCALQVLRKGFSAQFETYDGAIVFTELIQPAIHLMVFGSNYDVLPLLEVGKTQGWKLTVVGDLKKFGKSVFGLADEVLPENPEHRALQPGARSAAVLMAHDYKTDLGNLKWLLPTAAPYIAMLGPRKRFRRILDDLLESGITLTAADDHRLYAPAGLDIGATTPEGIALSIAAEIQAFFEGREAGFLRNRNAPIYEQKGEDWGAPSRQPPPS